MRDLKFRIFSKHRENGQISSYEITFDELEDKDSWQGSSPWERIAVCQYTGLKDKNDREIYEGDIVEDTRAGIMGQTDIRVYPITWGTEFAGFNVGEGPHWSVLNPHDLQRMEVIGNIKENPELLDS